MTDEIRDEAFADNSSMMQLEEARERVRTMWFSGTLTNNEKRSGIELETIRYIDLDTVIKTELELNDKGDSVSAILAGNGSRQKPYLVVSSPDLTRANAALSRYAKNASIDLPEGASIYYFHYSMPLNTVPSVKLCFASGGVRATKEISYQLDIIK
jgi:hypothetical protein